MIQVISGEMKVQCPLGEVCVREKEVLFLQQGDIRQARCDVNTKSLRMRWRGPLPKRHLTKLNSYASDVLKTMFELHQSPILRDKATQHLLLAFLDLVGQASKDSSIQETTGVQEQDFLPWILKAIEGKSNVSEGALVLGYHPDHFSRLFKSRYGIPPKKWLMQTRFNLARQWIEEDGLSTSQIVESLGLEDPSLFCLQFRKRFGCSPTVWKERSSKRS